MKKRSEIYGIKFEEMFTQEVFDRLKNGESFRFNLITKQIEDFPEEVTVTDVPYTDFVIKEFIHNSVRTKCLLIKDMIDTMIDYKHISRKYSTREDILDLLKSYNK